MRTHSDEYSWKILCVHYTVCTLTIFYLGAICLYREKNAYHNLGSHIPKQIVHVLFHILNQQPVHILPLQ